MKFAHLYRSPDAEGTANETDEDTIETTATHVDPPAGEETEAADESHEADENAEVDGEAPADGQNAVVQYQPNFKFKVMDKEHEFDKRFQQLIKSPDDEKFVRDLHNKAYGLEYVQKKADRFKTDLETVKTEHQEYRSQMEPVVTQLQEAAHYLKSPDINDMGNFFDVLGVPQQKVLQYALHVAKLLELPPEQRAAFEHARLGKRQVYQAAQENNSYQSQISGHAVQTRTIELQTVLTSPDVQAASEQINTKMGNPNFFAEEVLRHARFVARVEGKDLSALDAVNAVLERYGSLVQAAAPGTGGAAQQQAAPSNPPATNPGTQKTQQDPPVIPTVPSRQTAPVKKQIKSLDDIRARARELEQE